jgi:ankyrin repeat protein
MIKDTLYQEGPARQHVVFKTLSWIAWSMRPLESQELLAALATRTYADVSSQHDSNPGEKLWPSTDEELISLCPDILEVRHGRRVAFRDEHLRSLIRSPWSRCLGFASAAAAHESLASVCFHHLGCIDQETILRPWIKTGATLSREIRQCHLRSYCTNHWQDHYRAAEAGSRKLVAMLHSTLDAAFTAERKSRGLKAFDPASRMSTGIWICSLWDLEILGRTYLEMGADVDRCSGLNEAPLHVATANSSMNMLRLLLDRGADPEVRDKSGLTPLHQACRAGALEVAALLLRKGADPESTNCGTEDTLVATLSSNQTPLHLAAYHGHISTVKVLLDAGSNLEASTAYYCASPFHCAAKIGREEAVHRLMDLGADLEAEKVLSETALQIAIQERHDSIVRLLINKGAKRDLTKAEDRMYLDRVLGTESVASTVRHFHSLSLEDANVSSQDQKYVHCDIARPQIIEEPAAFVRFDDDVESAADCDWTMIEKMELEA